MIERSDQGVCAQCHHDCHEQPRQLDGNEMLWLHAECEAAFLQRRLAEEGLAATPPEPPPVASNGADHDAAPSCSLEPNLADINKHLYAIFHPDFVKDHPEAWIEIATADPTAGKGKTGVRSGKRFSVFELEKAAHHAVRMNKQGRNVYVGMALRQGETGPSGRATKDNVITACRGWADFDKEGDDVRVQTSLQQKGLQAAEMILTGSIPHRRFQIFFKLTGPVTPDELEAVNEAMRDGLGGNGDGVQNCDRVMRLAGTVSYPPPHKVERGYVPELTKLYPTAGARGYPVDELLRRLSDGPVSGLDPTKKAATGNGTAAPASPENFWRKVNDMALANLGAWVPEIFPDAKYQKGTGAYRISSENLGRKLEEDLSIHPKGITDWGIDDQGEKKEDKIGRRTAIDIVIEHGGAPDAKAAAFWLCERMAIDPASLGWGADANASGGTRPPPRWLDMSNWDHEPIPERQWAIPGLVPLNQVGLFSGEGGTGKSIIEITKNIAHVAAREWLGTQPVQGGAFYLGAEDDKDELHIRLAVIARHYGVTFAELIKGGLHVLPLLGEDAVLCAVNPKTGRVETTELYDWIYEQAGDLKPKNISVDTLSRAFAGNEINRVEVYAFAMHMQALAKVAGGSVTVLSHPSLSGIASGSGLSGSTAWHGAFRFRQYLKGVKEPSDDDVIEPPDNGLRLLEFKKNQYGPLGASLVLRYENGLFLPETGVSDIEQADRDKKVRDIFLTLLLRLDGQGRNVSHKKNSPNYAPTVFAREPQAKEYKFRKKDFEEAMRQMFDTGKIAVERYGRPSQPSEKLVSATGTE